MDEQPPPGPTPASPPPPGDTPPPPPPPAQPQVVYVPQQAATNGMATAALVLGIVGFFVPLVGVLAIVFGIMGITKANQGAPSKGMAIAGLVLGVVSVVFTVLVLIAVANIGNNAEGIFEEIGDQIEFCLDHPNDPDC